MDELGLIGLSIIMRLREIFQQQAASTVDLVKIVLGAIVGAVVGLVPFLIQMSKTKTEKPVSESTAATNIVKAAGELQDFYQELVKDLRQRLDDLEEQNRKLIERVDALESENRKLYHIVGVLVAQLKKSDIEPEIDVDLEE